MTLIVNGKLLGSNEIGLFRVHAEFHPPCCFAFMCPVCGEIWARSIVTDESGNVQRWMAFHIPCEQHHCDGQKPSGSIFMSWEPEFIEALPLPALIREFKLHLKEYHG